MLTLLSDLEAPFGLNGLQFDGHLYFDNVSLKQGLASPIDPGDHHILLINSSDDPITMSLPMGTWLTVDGIAFSGSVNLDPWSSIPFYRDQSNWQMLVSSKVILNGPFDGNTGLMDDVLRANGYLPLQEPNSSIFTMYGGGGESIAASVLTATGNDAIVDWVLLELRDKLNPDVIVASRNALVQRDGDVVAPSKSFRMYD